ncbi:WYL domain-containing protein [Ruania alkalisoli]|uniref:WYL domain-containing protein n=1 Tax=Ruania alkalisoli TaxID=2779775 RepID=A0A7M1SUB7_9MICO|nr:WYL domain-containing protein [Ruania alkalisoli]QOR71180.1 WYL domain-containing protein [Ruania alkalisoli]
MPTRTPDLCHGVPVEVLPGDNPLAALRDMSPPKELPQVVESSADHGTDELEEAVAAQARHRSSAESHELADAVRAGRPVQIRYCNASGRTSVRLVSEMTVTGSHLLGFCHSKGEERMFRLDQILAANPGISGM